MPAFNFPANDGSGAYIILDIETQDDTLLYQRYKSRDPRPAPCRWPFRRVVSATVMEVTVQNRIWEVTAFQSWSGPDDAIVIRKLFDWMKDRPSHRLVTYGGLSEDTPVLKTASMEFGLALPVQLRHLERDRAGWLHIDLALIMKCGSGSYIHQSELATRLGLPFKMAGSAGQVPYLVDDGNFEAVEWISECDVLLTALLLASHLASLEQVLSAATAHYVTMRLVRARRERANYHRELGNYVAKTEKQMMSDQRFWLAAPEAA